MHPISPMISEYISGNQLLFSVIFADMLASKFIQSLGCPPPISSSSLPKGEGKDSVMIHLFLFFHLFTSCAPSHDPQSVLLRHCTAMPDGYHMLLHNTSLITHVEHSGTTYVRIPWNASLLTHVFQLVYIVSSLDCNLSHILLSYPL